MDIAATGVPVFGSSGCPSSRTVNSGDRSLLLVAGWKEVAAMMKASTDSNTLARTKSAASTHKTDAPTARAINAILIERGEQRLTRQGINGPGGRAFFGDPFARLFPGRKRALDVKHAQSRTFK